MTPRAVIALGVGQLVNWGVLYYAFAMLVQPLERELGASTWVVAGAFSLALLTSALLAPAVGRCADGGRGALLIQGGGLIGAAVLVAWTFMPGVLMMYVVWGALGFCMAATLYEPAFVIVGRAYEDPARRLRALAAVTLFGGLASTVFLPGTAFLVEAVGWRGSVLALAALLVMSAGITRTFVSRPVPAGPLAERSAPQAPDTGTRPATFMFVVASFALAALASAGFAANLVPALGERGASTATAAAVGGLMGVMQLPGRALLMNGALAGSPPRLAAASLLLHAVGLAAVAFAPSTLVVVLGAMIFALGAGVTTLVRPHLIQTMFSSGSGGYLNGRMTRHQQLARAAGPLVIAWLGGVVGYTAAFAMLAGVFGVFALSLPGVLSGMRSVTVAKEAV